MNVISRLRHKWLRLRYAIALRDLEWMHYSSQQCLSSQRLLVCKLSKRLLKYEMEPATTDRIRQHIERRNKQGMF